MSLILVTVILGLSFAFIVQFLLPYGVGKARVL